LGQQRGGNLFHSFQDFNLQSWESATFSGPNHIQNVISRVTGGNPSNIDGLFRSTIPGADIYFLNPYGIVFGENAQLDVQGSFHASTADYLRLGDGGRFDARNPSDSLLTVAPIESFGFLDNPHGKIEIVGQRTDLDNPRALLQVPDGKSLSLIGGDIRFSQGVDELPWESIEDGTPEEIQATQYRNQRFSQLYAPGGTLNLASIRQAGEIALSKNGIHSTAMQGGTINLERQAYISSTGESGGNVFIRAGEFMMDNSTIYARTLGLQDGGVVDIQADNIVLNNGSRIKGGTKNLGDGTDIQLTAAESISLRNDSPLNTYAGNSTNINQSVGDAGHIRLQAKDIEINRDYSLNGVFSTDTYGTGRGGDLHISAENSLNIIDAYIQLSAWGDNAEAGPAGDIYLSAKTLNIEQGSWVRTLGYSADAGQLTIQAGTIYLGGLSGDYEIRLGTESIGKGHAGQITIRANELLLEDGASLTSINFGEGDAGNIDIQLTGSLTIRGASGATGYATGIFSSVVSNENIHGGNAGHIHISAKEMRIESGGRIDAGSKALHPTASSKKAGNVTLEIKEALVLSGVNPYGENRDGFGSVISARSQGENAGPAGNIDIHAGSVSILDGALLETGSDNRSHGGDIQIQADKHITISGDATEVTLEEPLFTQLDYLTNFNPETYNQSTSGVYAHSTSPAMESGDSGQIELSTPQLTLSNKGQISTASQGGGEAGQIILNVEKLVLSDEALIRSNSDLTNQLTFDSTQARDNAVIGSGTVIKIKDIGNGQSIYQINLGKTLLNFMPITHVADMATLEALPEQINLESNGDMFIVKNAGDGQVARFLYVNYEHGKEIWTRINEDTQVTLEQPDSSLQSNAVYFVNGGQPPYADGTLIHVKNMGNGKSADFVYVTRTFSEGPSVGLISGETFRVKYYQVADLNALQDLADSVDLVTGTQVDIGNAGEGNPARFVFDGENWVGVGQTLEVADIAARENLLLAQPGHIAHLPTGSTIYTGNEWINLGQTYRVNTLSERNALNVQPGDLVKVADVGNGRHDAFVYADGQWIQQIRGGDAGQITINADTIQLSDGSEISTGSISGGGGAITLNVDKMVFLNNSQITTSVQEGVGNGGDLSIKGSQFVIMNNGQIIAQAYEGQGGNIHLGSKQLVQSPCSQISASSELGIDGNVQVDSPAVDLDAMLVVLSGNPLEAKFPRGCGHVRTLEDLNTFRAYYHPPGRPMMPGDFPQ
jgi:filamentous hemagglutinin family protein